MLKYDQDLETVDGRYQVPDNTIVEHNVGCTLAMTTTTSSTESQRTEEYKSKVSMSAKVSMGASVSQPQLCTARPHFVAVGAELRVPRRWLPRFVVWRLQRFVGLVWTVPEERDGDDD